MIAALLLCAFSCSLAKVSIPAQRGHLIEAPVSSNLGQDVTCTDLHTPGVRSFLIRSTRKFLQVSALRALVLAADRTTRHSSDPDPFSALCNSSISSLSLNSEGSAGRPLPFPEPLSLPHTLGFAVCLPALLTRGSLSLSLSLSHTHTHTHTHSHPFHSSSWVCSLTPSPCLILSNLLGETAEVSPYLVRDKAPCFFPPCCKRTLE